MAKFKESRMEVFKCDECSRSFFGSEIVLEKPPANINMPFVSVIVIAYNDIIVYSQYDKLKDGDRMMHCPHCKHVHFYGFDYAGEDLKKITPGVRKTDNLILDKITPP